MLKIDNENLCKSCFSDLEENVRVCDKCGYIEAQDSETPMVLPLGTILLGKYIIGKTLGKGGFGVTYLAYNTKDNMKVAIKEYLPDTLVHRNTGDSLVTTYKGKNEESFKAGLDKFYEEAKTIAKFNGHPNIINVQEFFYENNTAYFVMEYIEGIDLKKYIAQKGGRLTEEEILRIILPLMDSLIVVHSVGVLHRDISPDNIYIAKDGTVKLLDFGSARQVLGEQSKSLSVVLKPGFAPIEQYQTRGKQGPWTDIYSLAATMYYCLTGQIPEASMDRMEEDNLQSLSQQGLEVSSGFENALTKALSVRAVNRYQTVTEFKNAFISNSEEANIPISSTKSENNSTPGIYSPGNIPESSKENISNPIYTNISDGNSDIEKPQHQSFFEKNKLKIMSAAVIVIILGIGVFSLSGYVNDNAKNGDFLKTGLPTIPPASSETNYISQNATFTQSESDENSSLSSISDSSVSSSNFSGEIVSNTLSIKPSPTKSSKVTNVPTSTRTPKIIIPTVTNSPYTTNTPDSNSRNVDFNLQISASEINKEQIITITIGTKNWINVVNGIAAFNIKIDYDDNAFEYIDKSVIVTPESNIIIGKDEFLVQNINSIFRVLYMDQDFKTPIPSIGPVFHAKFKLKTGTSIGAYKFKLYGDNVIVDGQLPKFNSVPVKYPSASIVLIQY
jgi:serine/threonine protein kinase